MNRSVVAFVLITASCAAQEQSPPPPSPPPKIEPMPMAYPPAAVVITEVLFRVPRGEAGDAGKDGARQATGDEFIEVANLSDKPVQLKGWRLIDSNCYAGLTDKGKRPFKATDVRADGKGVAFVFPELELKPGQVAVVFNGFEGSPKGPVGSTAAAGAANEHFAGAFVFAIRPTDKYAGLGDKGDWVMLISAEGELLESVGWGAPETLPPGACLSKRQGPAEPAGSITRTSRMSGFNDHAEVSGGAAFSPGVFATAQSSDTGVRRNVPKEGPK